MDYYPAPGRNHLFVPGPTNVPEPILRAMNRSNEDHRSPAFPKLSKSVIEDVKEIFGTTAATSFIFPTTGLVDSLPACPFANCLSERGDQ
jgi:alanine-glyoxylate transaminase/serine-glyoxylate transaminase/serine-pyruvate transaminase